MNQECVQHRIDLANRWEAPIANALKNIVRTRPLYHATLRRRQTPWFTEAWFIFATAETNTLGRFSVRLGIRLQVRVSTWQHSFEVVTLLDNDVDGQIRIHDEFDTLDQAAAYILHCDIDRFY